MFAFHIWGQDMGKKYGVSFSWKRASGLSAAKGRLSRSIGVPLTRSGRQRKAARTLGCLTMIVIGIAVACAISFFSSKSFADVVKMKSGYQLECVVLQENDDSILVRRGYGTMLLPR
ncbi:MAG TPA: hypothetical protein VGF52_03885, partial [Tepidisphaeraceae bacterium]